MSEVERYTRKAPGSLALPVNVPKSNEREIAVRGLTQFVNSAVNAYGRLSKATGTGGVSSGEFKAYAAGYDDHINKNGIQNLNTPEAVRKSVEDYAKITQSGENPYFKGGSPGLFSDATNNRLMFRARQAYTKGAMNKLGEIVNISKDELDTIYASPATEEDYDELIADMAANTGYFSSEKSSDVLLGVASDFRGVVSDTWFKSLGLSSVNNDREEDYIKYLNHLVNIGRLSKNKKESLHNQMVAYQEEKANRINTQHLVDETELRGILKEKASEYLGTSKELKNLSVENQQRLFDLREDAETRERERRLNKLTADLIRGNKTIGEVENIAIDLSKSGKFRAEDVKKLLGETVPGSSEIKNIMDTFKETDTPFSSYLLTYAEEIGSGYVNGRNVIAQTMLDLGLKKTLPEALEYIRTPKGATMAALYATKNETGVTDEQIAHAITSDKGKAEMFTQLQKALRELNDKYYKVSETHPNRAAVLDKQRGMLSGLIDHYGAYDANISTRAERGGKPKPQGGSALGNLVERASQAGQDFMNFLREANPLKEKEIKN